MEYLKIEKNDVTEVIENMKKGEFEQMCLVTYYSLSAYFKSLFTFGTKSSVARDSLQVIKEMFGIMKEERILLNHMLRNIDSINIDAVYDIVTEMDELNDKTIEYYYEVLGEFDDAVLMGDERRGIRPRKNFSTLTQTDSYATEIVALFENKDKIKSFLGYEEDFWEYIKDMDRGHDVFSAEVADGVSYVTSLRDENGNVAELKGFIAPVVDLSTALVAIKYYKRAYDLYKSIGSPAKEDNPNETKLVQDKYESELSLKAQALLKRKNVK